MSFQGDVRGIGLAELLQSLARGRKQGVVTLSSRGNPRVLVGLSDGRAFLLPTDEDSNDHWKELVTDAWIDVPGSRVEHLHLAEVARANRLESLYELLDGDGAHFRFEPRDIPMDPEGRALAGSLEPPVHPIPIEALLLEYARINDEFQGVEPRHRLPGNAIVGVYDPGQCESMPQKLFHQIDGRSTVTELANRLGWTLRQTTLSLGPTVASGGVFALSGDQTLILAIEELRRKEWRRAAVRLTAWSRRGTAGAMGSDPLEVLVGEWGSGRLGHALGLMEAPEVWTLLRRMDHGLDKPEASVLHWIEAARLFPNHLRIQLHCLAQESADNANPDRPHYGELLKLARVFLERGHPLRAQPLLRMAHAKGPNSSGEQLDLGRLLLESGLATEAAPWMLSACEDFIRRGLSDRAVLALRELTAALPREREARILLGRARRSTHSARRLRRRLLFTLAGVAGMAGVAVVQVNTQRQRSQGLAQVRAMIAQPVQARRALDSQFPGDTGPDVLALRQTIDGEQRAQELVIRKKWLADYEAVGREAHGGDSMRALTLARSLSNPPRLFLVQGSWPLKSDLMASIPGALADHATALGAPCLDDPEQTAGEERIALVASQLRESLSDPVSREEQPMARGLEALDGQLLARRAQRLALVKARAHALLRSDQNLLLEKARHLDNTRDLSGALEVYAQLFSTDDDGAVRAALTHEYTDLVRRTRGIDLARKLARSGQHSEALTLLREHCQNPSAWHLPVTITSTPSGAIVMLESGAAGTTPWMHEMRQGDQLTGRLLLQGYQTHEFALAGPSNLHPTLSRTPIRSWATTGRVDAIPVPVQNDHIVADRDGNLARIGPAGELVWTRTLPSLSGVSRAPVILPQWSERMVLVTEEGQAYLLDPGTGKLDGPLELPSPPSVGPVQGFDCVLLLMSDGNTAIFRDSLEPEIVRGAPKPIKSNLYGSNCGMHVHRRNMNATLNLTSRFGGWSLKLTDNSYAASPSSGSQGNFWAGTEGAWNWAAFESRTDGELLWISDGAGLRAFPLGN